MGFARKTMSVGTLGLVSFRSKKERLSRADRARFEAQEALAWETRARESAEIRILAAEKRVEEATANAARTERELKKVKRRKQRAAGIAGLMAGAEPTVRSGVESARHAGSDAAKRGRKAGRRARKAAKRATVATKEAVAPQAEKVATKISDAIDQL
jgi:hypothetical protein